MIALLINLGALFITLCVIGGVVGGIMSGLSDDPEL